MVSGRIFSNSTAAPGLAGVQVCNSPQEGTSHRVIHGPLGLGFFETEVEKHVTREMGNAGS